MLDARFSLDKRHVCIQRSSTDVDFVSLQDATEVAYQCREKGKGNTIHGFVWCNTSLCDLCLVTEMGLELVKLSPKLDGVKLVKHEKRAVDWFHYYHPCRTLLLCSGKDHSCLQPFQLLPDKLLKMPDFDPEVAIAPGGRRARLDRQSITVCKLYDKLCCIYIFAARQELLVYQLGKEAIGKLCTVNLFSTCDSYAVSGLSLPPLPLAYLSLHHLSFLSLALSLSLSLARSRSRSRALTHTHTHTLICPPSHPLSLSLSFSLSLSL